MAKPVSREAVSSPYKCTESWTADVVVVGAGLAGYCAALEAASCGTDVIMLEKQPEVGGSTVVSTGMMAFAGTSLQKGVGIEDSVELLHRDLMEVGGYVNDERLVKHYVERQLDTFDWLVRLGVQFRRVEIGAGQSLPRSHVVNPAEMIQVLEMQRRLSKRVRLVTEARVFKLLHDPKDDCVVGVLAEREGKVLEVRSRGGVVLACGGFTRNDDLIRLFAPSQVAALRFGGAGNTGDGLRMAWALGADLRDLGYIRGTFGFHPMAPPERHVMLLAIYKGAILVNQDGRRFVNESLNYKVLGDACLTQPFGMAYQIFDQRVFDRSVPGDELYDFPRRLSQGFLIKAETIEELAHRIEVPRNILLQTVAEYNQCVQMGYDRYFGREHLVHNFGTLVKIERPPFYAFPSTSGLVATYGGVRVDEEMGVINVYGERIEGLFAAGEICGGFHGAGYMTGTALGKAAIFGRTAGRSAAMRAIEAGS